MTMMVLDFAEEDRVDVNVKYSMIRMIRLLRFHQKIRSLEKLAEKSDSRYTKEDLEAVVDTLTGTFSTAWIKNC